MLECVKILLKYAGVFLGDKAHTHQTDNFRHLAANEHVYRNVAMTSFGTLLNEKITLPTGTFSTIDLLVIYGISIFIYMTCSC